MAATAVYAEVVKIPGGGRTAGETVEYTNISATTAAFNLRGGQYLVSVVGSTFGTVTLQRLGADGSTWLTALTAFAGNGTATAWLASGSYRLALA